MKTTWYVKIPAGRPQEGVHEFDTYMKGVTFLSEWGTDEAAAGRSLPDLQLTKVKPQQASAEGKLLPWVVIDNALNSKYCSSNSDPSRWIVLVPPRETAQRVYSETGRWARFVRIEAVVKRFATEDEAKAFKAAAVAVWGVQQPEIKRQEDIKNEAEQAVRQLRDDQQTTLKAWIAGQ